MSAQLRAGKRQPKGEIETDSGLGTKSIADDEGGNRKCEGGSPRRRCQRASVLRQSIWRGFNCIIATIPESTSGDIFLFLVQASAELDGALTQKMSPMSTRCSLVFGSGYWLVQIGGGINFHLLTNVDVLNGNISPKALKFNIFANAFLSKSSYVEQLFRSVAIILIILLITS